MGKSLFFTILTAIVIGNLLWWRRAHCAARRLQRPRLWQTAFALWGGGMQLCMLLIIVSRLAGGELLDFVPQGWMAVVYIWHVLFILPWLVWRGAVAAARGVLAVKRRWAGSVPVQTLGQRPESIDQGGASKSAGPLLPCESVDTPALSSRRQFLTAASLTVPPALATLAGWHAVRQFDDFRTRYVTLKIPNLPPALDGLKIAHVSDIHIGKFTDDPMLKAVVERTNAMRADLVLFNGDLIDWDVADLPAGLDLLKRLDPKIGLCMCEGNHDLLSGRFAFEQTVRAAGFPMPINDSMFFTVRGQPIQIMALRWGGPAVTDASVENPESDIKASTLELTATRQPGAFPILLAHHPHAFDYCGDIPLTLSGHTHGGQIRLGPISPASIRFRYLSGLYQRGDQQLFVSNGVGNWFPLRVGAPAEIGEITLRTA